MKNIIYTSFLALIILLGSCKGKSFLSQRYTHFPNGHKHVVLKYPQASKLKQKNLAKPDVQTRHDDQAGIITAEALAPHKELPSRQFHAPASLSGHHHFNKLPSKTAVSSVPAASNDGQQLSVANSNKAAASLSAKGLISDVLAIVLWVVLLAVLVCAIIILVLIM